MIPRSFIDDLIARVDIVELIDSAVPLKRSGKNYSACCPFHKEKTPSFTVSPDKQFYHCFGCGQSGNAIGFMMEYYRHDFVESVETLARRVGLEVPRETNQQEAQQRSINKSLYDLLEKANVHYQQQLRIAPDKTRAINYLKSRGLDGAIAKHFQIGYAPPGWNLLLNSDTVASYQAEQLVKAGLTIAKNDQGTHDRALQYDRFRDRIIYPIRDSRGRCIGFGGRVLGDDKPKYLNSPETSVFNKGKELYGFYEAKQADNKLSKVIVVEGYMDVIALAQMGVRNAVATLGTAIGSDHLHLILRNVNEVIFCFDGDKAGRQAAERALHNSLPFLQDGRQFRFLFLEEGEDPDSVVRKDGPELFIHKANNAQVLSEFLFAQLGQNLNLDSMDGRATLAKQATPLINQMPKGLFYEMMIGRLAEITQLDRSVVSQSLQNAEQDAINKANKRAALNAPEHSQPQKQPRRAHSNNNQHAATHNDLPPMEAYSGTSYSDNGMPNELNHYEQDGYSESFGNQTFNGSSLGSGSFNNNSSSGNALGNSSEPRVSTVQKVLSCLLRQPELALNCEVPEEVYKLKVHDIDLLIELLNYIKSTQEETQQPASTAMILGHWHNTKDGYLLASLAAAEPLLDSPAWEVEFQDAIKTLIKQFFHQEISLVTGSNEEDKARLKQLFTEKQRFNLS